MPTKALRLLNLPVSLVFFTVAFVVEFRHLNHYNPQLTRLWLIHGVEFSLLFYALCRAKSGIESYQFDSQ